MGFVKKIKKDKAEGNQRIITRDNLIAYLDSKGLIVDDTNKEKVDVIYARVSSHDQKQHADLDRQALFLVENVQGLNNPSILKEVGYVLTIKEPSSNNFSRWYVMLKLIKYIYHIKTGLQDYDFTI